MTLWNCWIVVRLFLILMIGGISYKRRQWLIWGYGDTRLPSLRTRGPKCHTSWAEMSHKQGQNVTQAGPKCHTVTINCINLNSARHTLCPWLYYTIPVDFIDILHGHFASTGTMVPLPLLPVKQPWRILVNYSVIHFRLWITKHNKTMHNLWDISQSRVYPTYTANLMAETQKS